jgi:DNA mismatch repair ATPase MutS
MPSLEKRIKQLTQTIESLKKENDFSKNLESNETLHTEFSQIKTKLQLLKKKINDSENYLIEDEFDDERSYSGEFEQLEGIKNTIDQDKNFKVEKLVKLYLESYSLIKVLNQKLTNKELEICII